MDMNTTTETMNVAPRFHGQVLNRIYRVWLFRKFLPVLLGEVVVLSVVFYELAKLIFLQRIAENAMNVFFQNPSHIFSFFVWAFVDARFGIKVLVVAIVVAIALVIRQVTQGLLRYILIRQNYFAKVGK